MRQLSASLLAAQKQASRRPYVTLKARDVIGGVVRLAWQRLYTGSEDDYYHGLALAGDGSMVRARLGPPSDSRKLYYQRVTSPGPGADFSGWTYSGEYNCIRVAVAARGAEVSIFIVNSSRELRHLKSTDYGATWGSPQTIDYSPTTAVYGLAAAYKPNGDLAVFLADASTLYVKRRLGGSWQARVAWDKTTGDLSGVAAVYGVDWDLLVAGQDSAGAYKLWSLVYGDGGDVAAGTWSDLGELASAAADGGFSYGCPFLDRPDVHRATYLESFSGTAAVTRPYWTHVVDGTDYVSGLWREPVPLDISAGYGLAVAHRGDYAWLSCPAGVWRAGLVEPSVDLTADLAGLRCEVGLGAGRLVAELDNSSGTYAAPGEGALAALHPGCRLDLGLGYITVQGGEVSPGLAFRLESLEHVSAAARATLVLHAADAWAALKAWVARHQFRWNGDGQQASVRDILAFVVARVGLRLEVKSQSSSLTGFYPDFTIHPGDRGDEVVRRLLSFVPDVLFIEGEVAYLVNPLSSDSSVYSYGGDHAVLEGRYVGGAPVPNRVRVEGYDAAADTPIIVDRFNWDALEQRYDCLELVADRNLDTVARAGARGDAVLRAAEMESGGGGVLVPVNCGQQPTDVIDITDTRAGLDAAGKRVRRIITSYRPERGEYRQWLELGEV